MQGALRTVVAPVKHEHVTSDFVPFLSTCGMAYSF